MDQIPVSSLSLVTSKELLPTVEADMDSFPESDSFNFDDSLAEGLASIPKSNGKAQFTIYYYYSDSVNFHERTYSVFIGLAGPERYLEEIHVILNRVPGVRVRFSDHISVYRATPMIHVEKGHLYRYQDEEFWYVPTGVSKQNVDTSSIDPVQPKGGEDSEVIEDFEEGRESIASRFRRARGDASVGSIKRTIERVFGLPEGSVKLCGPDGAPLKANAKVATLRKRWE